MSAYQKLIAKKKKAKKIFKLTPQLSDRSSLKSAENKNNNDTIQQDIQIRSHKKMPNILNPVEEPQVYITKEPKIITENLINNASSVLNKVHSVKNETIEQKNKKQIYFQEYQPDEEYNPIDKLDGIEQKLENINFFENITNLIGDETIRTNEGYWRIIEIGQNFQRNMITTSRILLTLYKILPNLILSKVKIYWLIAIILNIFFQCNKSTNYLIGVWVINIILELIFTLIHLNNKFQNAQRLDQQTIEKYDKNQWVTINYDQIETGDIIKVEPQSQFPCDCLLLSRKSSRLVHIDELINKGKSSVTLKQTLLQYDMIKMPIKGTIYLKNDKTYGKMKDWRGKINLKTEIFNIDFSNFVPKNSINMESEELLCIVLYTSINNKILEQVQYPKLIKSRKISTNLEKIIIFCIITNLFCSILEGITSYLFQIYLVNSVSYLPQENVSINFAFMQIPKYITQFIVILPLFAKLMNDIYITISCRITSKDSLFEGGLIINDEQAICELGRSKVIISKPLTLFEKSIPTLKSLKTKDIFYELGTNISQQKISTIYDFISAAHLSCQQIEDSLQKESILTCGKVFGINLNYNQNTVKLKQNNHELTVELLQQIPRTQQRKFNLTFYRENSTQQILCIIRGESKYLLNNLYQNTNNNEYLKQVIKIEKMNNCSSETLAKTLISPQILAELIENYQDNNKNKNNIKNLATAINKIIADAEILGYLFYSSPLITETAEILQKFHKSGITNVMICNQTQSRFLINQFKYPIETLDLTGNLLEEDGIHAEFNFRQECRVISCDTLSKIVQSQKDQQKLFHLIRIIRTVSLIIFNDPKPEDITLLLKRMKFEVDISTVGFGNCNEDLYLLKYSDVGIFMMATDQDSSYGDLTRYADIKLNNLKQFLKLLFVHSKDSYCGSSKLLIFLYQKNLMIFFCELIYSFYSLSTDIILIPVIYQYLLEIVLLSITPVIYFLFENQFTFDTIMQNPHLFKICNTNSLFNMNYLLKRFFVTLLQVITITFIIVYYLDSSSNGLSGYIKGHQFTGYIVFFTIYHVSLFKLLFFSSRFNYQQLLVIICSIPMYYITMAIISSPSVSYQVDIRQRSIFSHAFSIKNYIGGILVILECFSIELLLFLSGEQKIKVTEKKVQQEIEKIALQEDQTINMNIKQGQQEKKSKQKNAISYQRLLVQNME